MRLAQYFSRLRKYVIMGAVVVVMAALTAGCSLPAGQAPVQNKTLTVSWNKEIGPLNPHAYNPNQMFAQALVYEGLVQYDNGKVIPWLAESWIISPDGKEYIFTLRKDVKFADGTPFNAAVVKQNFDTIMANSKRHSWLELIKQIRDTQVVDEHTFKLVLHNPYYPTLQELSLVRPLRFLAPSAFPDNGSTAEAIKKPVGTGPWVLAEHRPGEVAVFVPNEHYWGVKPRVDKLIVKIIPDSEARVAAFEKKEIDLIYGNGLISVDAFKQLRDSKQYETKLSAPLATRSLTINSGQGPVRDLKVRQALAHAIDKDALVKGVFFGTEQKADTLFAVNVPYCNLGLIPYEYNGEKAGALLAAAGWKKVPGKEFREKEGQVLEIELAFEITNAIQKSIAEVLQGDCKKVGIRLALKGEESQAINQRKTNGNFEILFCDTWGAPYEPQYIACGAPVDVHAQSGLPMKAELDRKIVQVLTGTDEAERQALFGSILSILHEQAIYLPLTYLSNSAVYHKKLTGVTFLSSQYETAFDTINFRQ